MHPIPEAPFKPVAVEQGHEELEVLLLPVVRRGGHQEEVPRHLAQPLAQVVALGIPDLATPEPGRHLVGLVAHHQVPIHLGQFLLEVIIAGQPVEPADQKGGLGKDIAGAGRFDAVAGEELEGQVEAMIQFILPLRGQVAGAHHQAALQIAPNHQLFDVQPGHNGLARTGVIGQQKPQGLARQHLLVDPGDLMGQRFDQ